MNLDGQITKQELSRVKDLDNMKRVFLALMLSISILTTATTNLVYNDLNFEYTAFVYAVCTDLEIDNQIIYISHTTLHVQGFTQLSGFGAFIISVNCNYAESIKEVLAHELKHVQQHLAGIWDLHNPTTKVTKHGNVYVSEQARRIEVAAIKYGRSAAFKF